MTTLYVEAIAAASPSLLARSRSESTSQFTASALNKLSSSSSFFVPCVCVCASVEGEERGEEICMCITGGPGTKLCAGGKGESEGRVIRDATSRGLCG